MCPGFRARQIWVCDLGQGTSNITEPQCPLVRVAACQCLPSWVLWGWQMMRGMLLAQWITGTLVSAGSLHVSVTRCGLVSVSFDFISSSSSSSLLGSRGLSHTHFLLSSNAPGSLLRQGLGDGCFPGPECASFLYRHGLYFKCLLRCHVFNELYSDLPI